MKKKRYTEEQTEGSSPDKLPTPCVALNPELRLLNSAENSASANKLAIGDRLLIDGDANTPAWA